jgi:hypothetical protein
MADCLLVQTSADSYGTYCGITLIALTVQDKARTRRSWLQAPGSGRYLHTD